MFKNDKSQKKSELRSGLLNQLKLLSVEDKTQYSVLISANLKKTLNDQSGYWAAYQNLSTEPKIEWSDVSQIIKWCFPVVKNQDLQFFYNSAKFQESSLGVAEPLDGEVVPLEKIQGVVMPAIAFSRSGYRLGRGRGFYDRTLVKYAGQKIGVCFEKTLCDEISHEDHDVRCCKIVTEKNVYQVENSEGDSKWN